MNRLLQHLEKAVTSCLPADRPSLRRMLDQARRSDAASAPGLIATLEAAIDSATEAKRARLSAVPAIKIPEQLPIAACADEIIRTISTHQVTLIAGDTGCGKSTQLPKICLAAGRGVNGWIGHTQPRRLAARTIADRVAEELGCETGSLVGYKVRHLDQVSRESYIKVMTDGILLSELQSDRSLYGYDTLIIDEAHERNLNIDFILGYLQRILPKRSDLKVIITSATIDVDRFADYFNAAPVIRISGRTYPVELRYRPLPELEDTLGSRQQGLADTLTELMAEGPGDILVFLEGEREINDMARYLGKLKLPGTEVLPLYARLSHARQHKIFKPHQQRHIILATNVAETSLTIPAIRYVIDFGNARLSRYSYRSKVQRLPIEKISQASAEQRKGRCGRVADGICIRLYDEDDFATRPAFTDAEIMRTNLAAVILRMKSLKLGDITAFPFIDPPDNRFIKDGLRLLQELGALDDEEVLTGVGRRMARLPVDPRFARMLLSADEQGCMSEMLIIASALSIQDPRDRPLEVQAKADEAHSAFNDKRSDFLWFLNLWQALFNRAQPLSGNQLGKFCRQNFLSYLRIREWQDIHRQLREAVREVGCSINSAPSDYQKIHCALLSGLAGHVAFREEAREYNGARGIKLQLFPGSSQFKSAPKWIVAAELHETSRLYARIVAGIDPNWLLSTAAHLLKSDYFEPWWDEQQGQVSGYERISLYGLVIIPRRRINYGPVNPAEAREIFLRALTEGRCRSRGGFLHHNSSVVSGIRLLEQKARRPDILDEETLYEFYHERIPPDIYSTASFEKWRKREERDNSRLLYILPEMVMYHAAADITGESYPDSMESNGVTLPLTYLYDPSSESDGVTVEIPFPLLNRIDERLFERLVPGLLQEKIVMLLKALPKQYRKQLVPIPDTATACLDYLQGTDGDLIQLLGEYLASRKRVEIPAEQWRGVNLPDYLRMNFSVVDENGTLLASGRDIDMIRARLGKKSEKYFARLAQDDFCRDGITSWSFGELPESIAITRNGHQVTAYPALVDNGTDVSLQLFDSAPRANSATLPGLRRLFRLALAGEIKYLYKHLPGIGKITLLYATLGSAEEIRQDIIHAALDHLFLQTPDKIRSREVFDDLLEKGRKQLVAVTNGICELLRTILERHQGIRSRLISGKAAGSDSSRADIEQQLEELIYPGFLHSTPHVWLKHYPRYLEAITLRLDKLERSPAKDVSKLGELEPLLKACRMLSNDNNYSDGEGVQLLAWQIQELRVSLFAQELRTSMPVSIKRVSETVQSLTGRRI